MRIILGHELDGQVHRSLAGEHAEAGRLAVGLPGFVAALEQRLGFPERGDNVLRSYSYERALRTSLEQTPTLFFARSFNADPHGAAERLLELRDELLLNAPADFSLSSLEASGGRLADLASVERAYAEIDPEPGTAERIRAIVSDLDEGTVPCGVHEVELVDELRLWPRLVRELLQLLEERQGVAIIAQPAATPQARETQSDLAAVQRALARSRAGDHMDPTAAPSCDGSVVLVRGASLADAADAAALMMRDDRLKPQETVVVSAAEGDVLDEALHRAGLPMTGGRSDGEPDPTAQVLALFVLLQFKPVDLDLLCQYLELTKSPVPRRLRRALRKALQEMPGYQGAEWRKAWTAWHDDQATSESERERASFWLNVGTVEVGETLGREAVSAACTRFARWVRHRPDDEESRSRVVAVHFAVTVERVLDAHGATELSQDELHSFVADILRATASTTTRARESGAPFTVATPAAVLEGAGTVLVWGFSDGVLPHPAASFFTPEERASLAAANVDLPADDLPVRLHRDAMERALLAARDRLVLVCPDRDRQNGQQNPHPLWYTMMRAFGEPDDAADALSERTMRFMDGTSRLVDTSLLTNLELSSRGTRWSHLWEDTDSIELLERLSASGIETLLGCPLKWVLRYRAGLRPGREELPSRQLLYGKVAHEVLELYLTEDAVRRDPRRYAEDYINDNVSALLAPGADAERAYVIDRIARAGQVLASAMDAEGFRVAAAEKTYTSTEYGFELEGRTDLVLQDEHGERVVVDLKWGGASRYRKLLEDGRAVQLAVYRAAADGNPPAAYFIVSSAMLLTVHEDVARRLGTGSVIEGPGEEAVLEEILEQTSGIRERLRGGSIPVGYPEKEWKALRDSRPDDWREVAMLPAPCGYCDYRLFCGYEEREDDQ